ncbi:MAG: PIN domain-containing protein [Gemmataceae bacterium]
MTVFMDTFGLIARLHPRDQYHERVSQWLAEFNGDFVTTEGVLLEFADALCALHLRQIVVDFLEAVRGDESFKVLPLDSSLFEKGVSLFAERPDKEWSLTDCISFQVMAERGLTEAVTADHHFEQAGFRALFKGQ